MYLKNPNLGEWNYKGIMSSRGWLQVWISFLWNCLAWTSTADVCDLIRWHDCCWLLHTIDISTRKHTHNQKARPTLWLLAKKEGLCLFWFKLVKIYPSDQANFFTSSRKIWFVMVFDFAQNFCGFLFMVNLINCLVMLVFCSVSSLAAEVMTSELCF